MQDCDSKLDSNDFEKSVETNNRIMFLDCKEGVTYCTILSMFGVFFTNFAYSSYVFFILIFILEDPKTFAMTPELALSSASWLIFLCYPFNVVSSLISSYMFMTFGRRSVILSGFMICVTATLCVPYLGTKFYPNLIILTAFCNIGTAWCQNPPLIADYVRPSSIGMAYAIQGLLTFSATIFAVAVLFGTTKNMAFTSAAPIVCGIFYFMAFVASFGIKEIKPA